MRGAALNHAAKREIVQASALPVQFLFGFRNKNHFLATSTGFNDRLTTTEGDEWILRAVRAAAVPDMLPSQWT